MRKLILRNKSRLLSIALKLMGVCGVLILFEACYGTPKSAFVPNYERKNKNSASIKVKQTEQCKMVKEKNKNI